MKIEITETEIKLTPESSTERELLHNAKYRGVKKMQLSDIGHDNEALNLILGEDKLAKHYADNPK